MSLLKKQMVNTTVYNILTWISKLFVFPIIVKSFDVSEYGSYGLLNMFIVYGTIVGSAELYSYLRKELPGKEEEFQISMYKSVHVTFFAFISLLIFCIIFFGFKKNIAHLVGDDKLDTEIIYGFIIIIAEIATTDIVRYFVSIKKNEVSNFLSFFNQQAWGLTIITMFFMDIPITILLWLKIHAVTSFISLFLGIALIGFKKIIKAKLDIKYLMKALGFSYIILIGVFATQTSTYFSRYLITEMIGLQALGLFFFSMKLPQIANGFSTNIINKVSRVHLIESINKGDIGKMQILGGKLLIFNIVLYTLLIFPILLNLDGLIILFGKKEYLETKPLIIVLFFSNYFEIFSLVYYTYLFVKGRKDLMLYISIGKLIVNTLIIALLIYLFGLMGAAIAFLLSDAIFFLISYLPYRKMKLLIFPPNTYKFVIVGFSILVIYGLQVIVSQYVNTVNIYYFFISSAVGLLIPIILFKILNVIDFNFRKLKFSINWDENN